MHKALLIAVLAVNCTNNASVNYLKRIITKNLSGQIINESQILVKETPFEKLEQFSFRQKDAYTPQVIRSVWLGNEQFIYYDGELYKTITIDRQTGCKIERRASIVDYFESKTCNGMQAHHVHVQDNSVLETDCKAIGSSHECVTKENGHYFSSESSYLYADHSIFTALTPVEDEKQYDMFTYQETPNGRKTETYWISLNSTDTVPVIYDHRWKKTGEYFQTGYIREINEFQKTERFENGNRVTETVDLL